MCQYTGTSAQNLAEMADLGLSAEDYSPEETQEKTIDVWPQNMPTVDVYCAMRTQWRMTDVGPIGLDYGALPAVLNLMGIARKDRTEIFEGVRLMEMTELSIIRKSEK